MAACDSLQHIFEKSLPENPSLLESLSSSWKQIKPVKPIDHSFTKLFGEQETTPPPPAQLPYSSFLSSLYSSSSVPTTLQNNNIADGTNNNESPLIKSHNSFYNGSYGEEAHHKNSDSFSAMNPESLQLCTEGLGFESSDDVEDLKKDQISSNSNNKGGGGGGGFNNNINDGNNFYNHRNKEMENVCVDRPAVAHSSRTTSGIYLCSDQYRRARTCGRTFPPPISCIGRTGKPWVCFKSYRHDGRFVLQEVRIPTQEFLHACRQDGRLRLSLVQSDDDHIGFDEEEEDDDELVDQEINKEDDEETREGSC